jgi:hypothetical protein
MIKRANSVCLPIKANCATAMRIGSAPEHSQSCMSISPSSDMGLEPAYWPEEEEGSVCRSALLGLALFIPLVEARMAWRDVILLAVVVTLWRTCAGSFLMETFSDGRSLARLRSAMSLCRKVAIAQLVIWVSCIIWRIDPIWFVIARIVLISCDSLLLLV